MKDYYEIELLKERYKSRIMKEYYLAKEEQAEASLDKIKNYRLVKQISRLLDYNSEDLELLKSKKLVLGYCLEDIKIEKRLQSRIEEIEKRNIFEMEETESIEDKEEINPIDEVKEELTSISRMVLKMKE